MRLLDGKTTAKTIRNEVAQEVAELTPRVGRAPGLSVILVGDDPASQVYVRNKEKAAREAGIMSETILLPVDTPQQTLEALIDELNAKSEVDGILLQLPLPSGLDSQRLLERIDPDKDVDGFHPQNMGRLALGLPGFKPCTPAGVIELLKRHDLSPSGKKAVVVGRSNIVGKPLAMMLSAPGPCGDATVTLCHSKTADLMRECREADFLFLALGQAEFIKAYMIKPGAVVVDIGISRTDYGLKGDADFASVRVLVEAISPVPGGVGPMTIAMLLSNTVKAFKLHNNIEVRI